MRRNYTPIITVIVLLIIIGLGVYMFKSRDKAVAAVSTYEECVAAGNAVINTTPPQCRTADGRVFVKSAPPVTSTTTPPVGKDNLIKVTSPIQNQVVTSPLVVTGQARGYWFFEASFPVKILDANGKLLGTVTAQAQSDWMTQNFVPFKATLTFAVPTTTTGTLVLEKDNPSGLPQNADELRIPVRFATTTTEERIVKLYYYDPTKDVDSPGNILCSAKGLVAVERRIPVTNTPIQDTIKLLLRGELTTVERSRGITTEFPLSGFELTGASLSNGVLTLTFKDPQNKSGGGACRVNTLRAQIEFTAKQFPGINSVVFMPGSILQP